MPQFRDTILVAWFDLIESLRSKQAIALLALYATFALGGCGIFAALLRQLSHAAETQLGARNGDDALVALMESEEFFEMVAGLIGNFEVAEQLVTMHPMALFYGWFAITAVPLLVLFTSSTAIASEVHSGASRFALFRTDRASWTLGKLTGQSILLAIGLAVGALSAFLVGTVALRELGTGALGVWLVRMSARAWFLGFAFLGLYLGVSQFTRSVAWARALAVLSLFAVGILGSVLGSELIQDLVPFASYLHALFPAAHSPDLWHPSLAVRAPAMVALMLFGLATFALGTSHFSRRDA